MNSKLVDHSVDPILVKQIAQSVGVKLVLTLDLVLVQYYVSSKATNRWIKSVIVWKLPCEKIL